MRAILSNFLQRLFGAPAVADCEIGRGSCTAGAAWNSSRIDFSVTDQTAGPTSPLAASSASCWNHGRSGAALAAQSMSRSLTQGGHFAKRLRTLLTADG